MNLRWLRLGLFFTFAVSVGGCTILGRNNAPLDCSPHLQQLLLTTDDFPKDWTRGVPVGDDEFREGAIDSCLVSFYILNGVAGEFVNEYRIEKEATVGYTSLMYLSWGDNKSLHSTLAYYHYMADDYIIECAIPRDTPMCQYLARYGNYVVRFQTHYCPEFMQEEDLMLLLRAIDERLRYYVSGTSSTPLVTQLKLGLVIMTSKQILKNFYGGP